MRLRRSTNHENMPGLIRRTADRLRGQVDSRLKHAGMTAVDFTLVPTLLRGNAYQSTDSGQAGMTVFFLVCLFLTLDP